MNELTKEKTMTVKELAEALGVSLDTVKNSIRRIMPNKMQNGKTTYLNEVEVAAISKELKRNVKVTEQLTYEAALQVKNSTTELEVISNALSAFKALQDLYTHKEAEYKATIEAQKEKIALDAPKVEFFDDVCSSLDTIEMKEVAKVLNIHNVGRNKLFEILRNEKILDKNNQPYQSFVDRGYFRIIENRFVLPSGEIKINLKTVVFQKGLVFIRKVLKKAQKRGEKKL